MARIQSLEAFWPHYLSEHRHPTSRMLHFVGTSGFFVAVIASFVYNPLWFSLALGVALGFGWYASSRVERERPAFLPMLGVIVPLVAAAPWTMPLGIVSAYACAWVGHFRVEHNRPATFSYPVWSFLCDFRMWGQMVRGRLWSGDPVSA
jgi:hypothetical protein